MSTARKPIVMVVDDSRSIIDAVTRFLGDNYSVIKVKSGYSALAVIQERIPDLIFMDVVMPGIDGYDTCIAIRENPKFADIPIVILSGRDSPFDKALGEQIGCNDYLTKPFVEAEIQAILDKYIK